MFNKQAKRLARATAAQLYIRQIGLSLYAFWDGGGGLFSRFSLTPHAAAAQTLGIGFELTALHEAVLHTIRYCSHSASLRVIPHTAQPIH